MSSELLMEGFFLSEHDVQGSDVMPVQTGKKKRSQSEKLGRHKWNQILLKRVYNQNLRVLDELRWVRRRLQAQGESDYTKPMIERFAVADQVDLFIVEAVREAGDSGVFPKDIAAAVNKMGRYGLKYYAVSRSIVRMNKRLHF
jgi:hypothetical protein